MGSKMKIKTLYFVKGIPSSEQKEFATEIGAKIRTADRVYPNDPKEDCNFVVGEVPEHLAKCFDLHERQEDAMALIAESGKPEKSSTPEIKEPANPEKSEGQTDNENQTQEDDFDRVEAFKTLRDAGVAVGNSASNDTLKAKLDELAELQ